MMVRLSYTKSLLLIVMIVTIYNSSFISTTDGETSETTMKPIYGCSCHSGNWTLPPDLVITLDTPNKYESSQAYLLTISVSGGPEVSEQSQNQGGFTLWASGGLLSPTDNSTKLVTDDPASNFAYLTHTEDGNNQRTWKINWTAPSDDSDSISMGLTVLVANGDGNASNEDQWGRISFQVNGMGYEDDTLDDAYEGEPSNYGTPGFGIFAAASAIGIATIAAGRTSREE